MGVITSDNFSFTVPKGWTQARDGDRVVMQDNAGSQIAISSCRLDPPSPDILNEVLNNAFTAIRQTAPAPEFETVDELAERSAADGLRRWTMFSRSKDGKVLLTQAVFAVDSGVLLVLKQVRLSPKF
jgi:hypothetical protein